MGLKFRRFKAKLNWKTKETTPDIVCLRYQIHSEFDEEIGVPIPATSSTQLGTSDVIKQKKPASKPPVQSVFESSTSKLNISTPSSSVPTTSVPNTSAANSSPANTSTPTNINVNNVNNKTKTNGVLITNQNTGAATTGTVPTKGILKKSTPDENVVSETKQNQNNSSDIEDYKKSALIFMTENHDESEEPTEEKRNTKEIKEELDLEFIDKKTTVRAHQEEETGEFRFCNARKTEQETTEPNFDIKDNYRKHETHRSDSESEESDVKTVRWRETIIEINPANLETDTQKSEESADDFKVHFVKHQNFSTTGLQSDDAETEESEPEENHQPKVNSYYGNRGAYSSQAASIFFAGEEPEPTPRVRNVTQQEDEVSGDVHSSA